AVPSRHGALSPYHHYHYRGALGSRGLVLLDGCLLICLIIASQQRLAVCRRCCLFPSCFFFIPSVSGALEPPLSLIRTGTLLLSGHLLLGAIMQAATFGGCPQTSVNCTFCCCWSSA